jgi:hypothetical protein
MNVQQISFMNNLKRPEQKPNSASIAFSSAPDKFDSSNKKDNTGKYISASLGAVLAIIAIIKHKQIGEFLNKLFKNGKKAGSEVESSKPPFKDEPPVVQPKTKFELPKPEFKFDKTNPVEFAKEQDAYMRTIIPYADTDEKTALEVMEQFNEHGSNKLLENLTTSVLCTKNKTEKIANKFLRLFDKCTKDESNLENISTAPLSAIIEDYGDVLSKDSIKLIIQGFKKAGSHPGDLLDTWGFMKGDQHYHPFLSKFNQSDIDEIDKLAQDAEEIVRKRVYKD